MTFADILLRVVPTAPDELERLSMAVDLARRLNGRLNGLFVVGKDNSKAEWAKSLFERAVVRSPIETTWRVMDGSSNSDISFLARRADLIMVPATGADRSPAGRGPEQVAFGSGRPILILPSLPSAVSIGNTVLVGWNETAECARAVHDAMPILSTAEKVYVLTIVSENVPEPIADIQLLGHLRQHGVRVELLRRIAPDPAEAIAEEMRRVDADLLVIGLHSKPRATGWIWAMSAGALSGQDQCPCSAPASAGTDWS